MTRYLFLLAHGPHGFHHGYEVEDNNDRYQLKQACEYPSFIFFFWPIGFYFNVFNFVLFIGLFWIVLMETKEFYVPVLTESQYIKRLIMNSSVPFFFRKRKRCNPKMVDFYTKLVIVYNFPLKYFAVSDWLKSPYLLILHNQLAWTKNTSNIPSTPWYIAFSNPT